MSDNVKAFSELEILSVFQTTVTLDVFAAPDRGITRCFPVEGSDFSKGGCLNFFLIHFRFSGGI